MGYDGKPIGPDLTIVTVVLQHGVFPSVSNGIQYVGMCASGWDNRVAQQTVSIANN